MAGFFSLGSGTGTGSGRDPPEPPLPANTATTTTSNNNNPNWAPNPTQPGGLLLYRNEEIYQKGFEIWQQYVQVHHHHPPPFLHHHHHLYLGSGGGGGGDPYYPSPSSAGPSGGSGAGSRVMMRPGGSGGGGGSGGMNCQDCGNQAKKDCTHMRCRTCCKSRGFDCATHVKSTWVPAAKRRERHQQQLLALQQQQQQQQPPQHHLEIMGTTREKRLRESRDPPPPPQLGASTSGLEVGQHFPAELSSQAVFRCVRVHSVDDPDEQLAYQTAINVGGHLFKGILYDQGPESHPPLAGAGDSSSGGEASGVGNIQPHSLLTAATSSNEAALVDPNAMYPPPPISAFLAGTQFFPPPRS